MKNNNYKYSKDLIINLGYEKLVKKYKLENEKINNVIFYAINSLASHIVSIKDNFEVKNILLGDYYSFSYYSYLIEDLSLLNNLTTIMEKNYLLLIKDKLSEEEIIKIILSLPKLFLALYNLKLDNEDKKLLVSNFVKIFNEYLTFYNHNIEFQNILRKVGVLC